MFSVKNLEASTINVQKRITNEKVCNTVISPVLIHSPFSIPDSPKYISIKNIEKMRNIYKLKKLEYEYDEFLEKKCQILLLLNIIDEVFEIRDSLIMRINNLERYNRHRRIRDEYNNFIQNILYK